MANCCLCGKKIGVFENKAYLKEGFESTILCENCGTYYGRVTSKFIASEETKKQAIKYLEKYLHKDNVDSDVKSMLEEKLRQHRMDEEEKLRQKQLEKIAQAESEKMITNILEGDNLITSGYDFCGYDIMAYRGVVSGEVVLGTGFLSEFTSSFSDFFGT